MSKLFQDAEGNKSSKRVIGAILLLQGCIMKWMLFFKSIKITDVVMINGALAMEASDTLIYAGATLLGLGVLEGLGKLINSKIRKA